jgi:hypothetical protein
MEEGRAGGERADWASGSGRSGLGPGLDRGGLCDPVLDRVDDAHLCVAPHVGICYARAKGLGFFRFAMRGCNFFCRACIFFLTGLLCHCRLDSSRR